MIKDGRPTLTRHVIPRDIFVECDEGDDGAMVAKVKSGPPKIVGRKLYADKIATEWVRLVGVNRGVFMPALPRTDGLYFSYAGVGVVWSDDSSEHTSNLYIENAAIVEYRNGDTVIARVVE